MLDEAREPTKKADTAGRLETVLPGSASLGPLRSVRGRSSSNTCENGKVRCVLYLLTAIRLLILGFRADVVDKEIVNGGKHRLCYHPCIVILALYLVNILRMFLMTTICGITLYLPVGPHTAAGQSFISYSCFFGFMSTIPVKTRSGVSAVTLSVEGELLCPSSEDR